jgi:hypothetical protein
LASRFQEQHKIIAFQKQYGWDDHHVIGLHIRGGNGEERHFQESNRSLNDSFEFTRQVVDLIARNLVPPDKPPLLFLATDTPSLIPVVQSAAKLHQIPAIIFPQDRLEENQGVSFAHWTEGAKCLAGWNNMWIDSMLLASSNVLVAGTFSTFTQVLPRTLVLGDARTYCEVDRSGSRMSCFQDPLTWLFRQKHSEIQTYSLDDNKEPVLHKLALILPDIKPDPATETAVASVREFLQHPSSTHSKFGSRFNQGLRYKTNGTEPTDFNWTSENV